MLWTSGLCTPDEDTEKAFCQGTFISISSIPNLARKRHHKDIRFQLFREYDCETLYMYIRKWGSKVTFFRKKMQKKIHEISMKK